MTKTRRWSLLLLAGLLVLAAATTTIHLVLAQRQTAKVAMPADDATPEQVVGAYLAALNAHDCATAEALTQESAQGQAERWCEDVAGLRDISVGQPFTEKPRWSGHPATWEIESVPVRFDLDWRFLHSDPSMPEGPTGWSYLVGRASPSDPWRIFDQGDG